MKFSPIFLLLMALLSNSSIAKSLTYNKVNDLNFVVETILADKADAEETLIIFDIDDTLLEASDFVGSGRWYNWQRGREVRNKRGELFTSRPEERFHCIFRTLGSLFEYGSTHLTQQDIPNILTQVKNFDNLILTARTTKFRAATERELNKHKISLRHKHLFQDSKSLSFNFNDNRRTDEVTYKNGIVMVSGLNKGLVLKKILKELNKTYQRIYFVDDSRKNINDMAKAWKDDPTRVTIFHYSKVDQSISDTDVEQSNNAKRHLDNFMNAAFPKQHQAFKNKQCD